MAVTITNNIGLTQEFAWADAANQVDAGGRPRVSVGIGQTKPMLAQTGLYIVCFDPFQHGLPNSGTLVGAAFSGQIIAGFSGGNITWTLISDAIPLTCNVQNIATLSTCFSCVPDVQALRTYLMAVFAGGSLNPGILATASSCYLCLAGQYEQIRASLLCRVLNVYISQSCDPQALVSAAVGFDNLPNYTELYMWAVLNGGSLDPGVLSAQAACFKCLQEMFVAVQLKLLCDMTGTAPCNLNTLSANAACFRCIPDGRLPAVVKSLVCQLVNVA